MPSYIRVRDLAAVIARVVAANWILLDARVSWSWIVTVLVSLPAAMMWTIWPVVPLAIVGAEVRV